jgi:hypothetical protein
MKMRLIFGGLSLIYSFIAAEVVISVLSALDGLSAWGDGATHLHTTPYQVWVFVGIYFLGSVLAAFIPKRSSLRIKIFVGMLVYLVIALWSLDGVLNAIFLAILLNILCVPIWIASAISTKEIKPNQSTDPTP